VSLKKNKKRVVIQLKKSSKKGTKVKKENRERVISILQTKKD
jgi:hypothetical protein